MLTTLVTLHKVLGDASRIRIAKLLQEKELCVSEISSILGLAMSTVSKHLLLLRTAGVINERRGGKRVYCQLNKGIANSSLRAIVNASLACLETDVAVPRDRRRAQKPNGSSFAGARSQRND